MKRLHDWLRAEHKVPRWGVIFVILFVARTALWAVEPLRIVLLLASDAVLVLMFVTWMWYWRRP